MSRRLLKVFLNLGRCRQIQRCASATRQWPRLTAAYVGIRVPLPFTITLASGSFEFREFSDIPTFWQIFFRDEYSVRTDDRVIIDAGANIGASPVYFLSRYPDAAVVANVIERRQISDRTDRACQACCYRRLHRHVASNRGGGTAD